MLERAFVRNYQLIQIVLENINKVSSLDRHFREQLFNTGRGGSHENLVGNSKKITTLLA